MFLKRKIYVLEALSVPHRTERWGAKHSPSPEWLSFSNAGDQTSASIQQIMKVLAWNLWTQEILAEPEKQQNHPWEPTVSFRILMSARRHLQRFCRWSSRGKHDNQIDDANSKIHTKIFEHIDKRISHVTNTLWVQRSNDLHTSWPSSLQMCLIKRMKGVWKNQNNETI